MIIIKCQHCHQELDPTSEGQWMELRFLKDPYEDSMHLCPECQQSESAVLDVVLDSREAQPVIAATAVFLGQA